MDADNNLRIPYLNLSGQLIFLVLGLLAVVFYLERATIIDAAYQVWAIFYNKDLAIQANRFGSAVTKIWPYLAFKAGLPLQTVLISYSLGFVLYPYLLYVLIGNVLRNQKAALTILLFSILLVSHTFYWVQSELLQGCLLVLALFGLISTQKGLTWWILPIDLLLTVVCLFFHPLIFIPFFFCWVFFWLHEKEYRGKIQYLVIAVSAVLILVYKHFFLPAHTYDAKSMELSANLFEHFQGFFTFRSNRLFLKYCFSDYYLFPILGIAVTYYYWKIRRNLWKLSLTAGACLFYIALVNGSFMWGPQQFYMESYYQVLSIFIGLPLVYDLLPYWQQRFLSRLWKVFLIVIALRLLHIGITSIPYTHKVNWNKAMLEYLDQHYTGQKFVIYSEDAPTSNEILWTWGIPCETTLLSGLKGPDSVKTIIILDKAQVENHPHLKKGDVFLTHFGPILQTHLPTRYFNFKDPEPYQLLPAQEVIRQW